MSKLQQRGCVASFFVLVCNKDHMIPIYVLMHQFSLSSFGAQGQCCNLQSVYIRTLQFICSDLRLLVVERVRTCQDNRLKIPYLARLLAPDYTGVGGSLT